MYEKILVPLDQSMESQDVLPLVQELLTPEGETILLHIIPPARTTLLGESVMPASQGEEAERHIAMVHLRRIASRIGKEPGRRRCEVSASASVADGIADFARQEEVDLIAMYTHDRKGLAKLIKGSIAEKVKERATTEVRVVRPRELVAR